jgi:outer membrane protein assembly factor BamB
LIVTSAAFGDWPQFHGPRRDNISTETGLLKKWPEGGPKRIFEAEGMGRGYSTVAIAGERIFTTGNMANACVITAMDLSGKVIWRKENGEAWQNPYPGSRSTPVVDGEMLYHYGAFGDLACMEAATGKVTWKANVLDDNGGRLIRWGLSEAPLIYKDKVVCMIGGRKAGFVALDKKTGKVAWKSDGPGDKPGYCTSIPVDHKGLDQLVTLMSWSVVGVRLADGKVLWRYKHEVRFDENIAMPVYADGRVAVSAAFRKGVTCLKLNVDGEKCTATRAWHNSDLDNRHGGLVLSNARLYGHAERHRSWACLDFKTGRTLFISEIIKCRSGSLTMADGMLYLYTDEGEVGLAAIADKGLELKGSFKVEKDKDPTWAHPVVCGGRLYIRHGDLLSAFDVKE